MRLSAVFPLLVAVTGTVAAAVAEVPSPWNGHAVEVPTIVNPPAAPASVDVPSSERQRAFHLQQAAEHLRAAGLGSLAEHVLTLSDATAKSPPVAREAVPKQPRQILLHFCMSEFDVTKLRARGIDMAERFGTAPSDGSVMAPRDASGVMSAEKGVELQRLIEKLRADGAVRILAEPTLVAIEGRAASFHSGGEIPILSPDANGTPTPRYKRYGTSIDLVPILTGQNRLHLELRCECSSLDPTRNVTVNGQTVPGINSRIAETAVEMDLGQSFFLFGPPRNAVDKDGGHHELAMALLVTAEAVDPMAAAPSADRGQRR